jgi:hypothetical protein
MSFKVFNNTHTSRQIYEALTTIPVWNADQLQTTDVDRDLRLNVQAGNELLWNGNMWIAADGSSETGNTGPTGDLQVL